MLPESPAHLLFRTAIFKYCRDELKKSEEERQSFFDVWHDILVHYELWKARTQPRTKKQMESFEKKMKGRGGRKKGRLHWYSKESTFKKYKKEGKRWKLID